jgi:hypothetical protein
MAVPRVERARRLARFRAARRLYASFSTEKNPAARARRLLREWLSPDQSEMLDRLGYFEVIGNMTGKRFRIMEGTSTNVVELDEKGEPCRGWCFVPAGQLEAGDVMLAQKIALETWEANVRAVANWFPPKVPFTTRSLLRRRPY